MRQYLLDLAPGTAAPVAGDSLLIDEGESHHLLRVMRRKTGDQVTLTDGAGGRYRGVIVRRESTQVRIEVREAWQDLAELAEPILVLACAVVKGRRFEWALEKSVELGVHRIVPLHTEHTVVDPGSGKQERWQTVLRSALKQSGRSYLPRLLPVTDLRPGLEPVQDGLVVHGQWPLHAETVTAGHEGMVAQPRPPCLTWVVGPEGGWSEAEAAWLVARSLPLNLGPHPLRTETAALAGLVILQGWRQHWLQTDREATGDGTSSP